MASPETGRASREAQVAASISATELEEAALSASAVAGMRRRNEITRSAVTLKPNQAVIPQIRGY
jgi:hypothetical protein